jgi:hypothetical protein
MRNLLTTCFGRNRPSYGNTDYQQDRQCTCNVTLRRVRATIVAVEKQTNIVYPECVFLDLGIQHANACAILLFVACPAVQYFSTFPINGMIFGGKKDYSWVLIFSTTFVLNTLRRTERDTKNVYSTSCKVSVILFRFQWKLNFHWHIFEKYTNIIFHENPLSGSRVVPYGRTNEQIDITKVIVAMRNFANKLENTKNYCTVICMALK